MKIADSTVLVTGANQLGCPLDADPLESLLRIKHHKAGTKFVEKALRVKSRRRISQDRMRTIFSSSA